MSAMFNTPQHSGIAFDSLSSALQLGDAIEFSNFGTEDASHDLSSTMHAICFFVQKCSNKSLYIYIFFLVIIVYLYMLFVANFFTFRCYKL